MTPLRRRMLEDMQVRNLSANTQKSYVHQVSLFARRGGGDGYVDIHVMGKGRYCREGH